jgi:ABC-type amino acid transport substrate-binding protein
LHIFDRSGTRNGLAVAWSWAWSFAWLCAAWLAAPVAQAQPATLARPSPLTQPATAAQPLAYRWKAGAAAPNVSVGKELVSDEERAYLAALPEIRVALDAHASPPYETIGANGEVGGFQADLLLGLARIFGLKVRPVVYPDWPSV